VEEQDREHGALARCAQVETAITVESLEWAKDPKLHVATVLRFAGRLYRALGPCQSRAPILFAKTAEGGHDGRSIMSISKRPVIFVALAVVVAALTAGAPIAGADPWFNDRSSVVRPDDRAGARGPGALASADAAQRATRPDDRAGARGPGAVASAGATQPATRPDDRAGARGPGAVSPGTSTIVVRSVNTFDWGDAAIGVVSGMGFALLLAGLAVLTVVTRTKTRMSTR
jgi:hypothetical protein